MTFGPCPLCKGTRLSQAALSSKINGRNIAELAAMEVDELIDVIRAIKGPGSRSHCCNAHRAAAIPDRYWS